MSNIDPESTHQTAELKHDRPLTNCRVDPTGRFAFAGAEDLNVYRWHLEDATRTTLAAHDSWVRSMDFSSDGKQLLTAGWDGRLAWWPVADPAPKPTRIFDAHDGSVRWVRADSAGKYVATCGNDKLVKVWDANTAKLVWRLAGHQRHVYSVEFHPDGRHLVSGDLMGVMKVWDLQSGKQTSSLDASVMTGYDKKFAADMGGARDMRFSADGKVLACAGITNVRNAFAGVQSAIVLLIDWQSGKPLRQLKDGDYQGVGWGVRFHRDGFIISSAAHRNGSGALWFFKQGDDKPFHSFRLKACGRGLDMTSDQTTLLSAQSDGYLRLYKMTAKA